jgi:hypothetical protein
MQHSMTVIQSAHMYVKVTALLSLLNTYDSYQQCLSHQSRLYYSVYRLVVFKNKVLRRKCI